MSDTFVLVADWETGKIGCALMQATFGGTVPSARLAGVDWETGRVEHMQPYRVSAEQLDQILAEREGADPGVR